MRSILRRLTSSRPSSNLAPRDRGRAVARALVAGAAASLAIGAYGCNVDAPRPAEPVGEATSAVTVCPGGPTVPGIDVSAWQGQIDWDAAAASGLAFAITRIGDGYGSDQYFQTNWAAIKAHGMVRGAYQFYEPNDDPVTLANEVVQAVGTLGPGDLPVTLDVEWTSGTPSAGPIQQWVDIVTQGTGKRPMIYTAVGYWNQYFNDEFSNLDLWVANWSVPCPALPNSWQGWVFWQTGGGSTPGIAGNVDQDVFNGSLQDLQMLANADTSSNCSSSQAGACAHFGCHCANDACNGGFCPGGGCTQDQISACGNFGCNCVDGQCNGGFCPGKGCTAKEEIDCQNQGMGCVDHGCSNGCTAKEQIDCGNQNMDCMQHQCTPKPMGSSSSSSSSSSTSGAASSSSSSSTSGAASSSSSTSTSSGEGAGGAPGDPIGQGGGDGVRTSSSSSGAHVLGNGGAGDQGAPDGGGMQGSCAATPSSPRGSSFGAIAALGALAIARSRRRRAAR